MDKVKTKVYIASTKELEDEQVFQSLYQTVSKKRQDKIDRLKFPKDKRLSLAAEVLLKKALAQNGIHEYEIETAENGKPYLKGEESVYFNLSHSEERVMCVISDREVGCDVEQVRETDYKVAKHFFTTKEYEQIERCGEGEENGMSAATEAEKMDRFFRLWTLKESFMKAVGLGMKLSLKDFYFMIEEEQIRVYQNVNREQYYFREYNLKDGYRYAVCSLEPTIGDIVELKLSFQQF